MTIETKFNVKDEVWFMQEDKVVKEKIWDISVTSFISKKIVYAFFRSGKENNVYKIESELFPTKEALLQSL